MTVSISSFGPDTPTWEVVESLQKNGAVVLTGLASDAAMDTITEHIDPAFGDGDPVIMDTNRTLGSLFSLGPMIAETLLLNERILAVADAILLPHEVMSAETEPPVASTDYRLLDGEDGLTQMIYDTPDPQLGPNCAHYRVGVGAALQVRKGSKAQMLHRETDVYEPFVTYGPQVRENILAVMWAGTDYRLENGATNLVPGSQHWPRDRVARPEEIARAVMPKGSAVLWLGKTLHGSAASTSDDLRTGLLYTLVPDWLTQEENQYISVPPAIARELPLRARQLLGYRASPSIGWVKGRDGQDILTEGKAGPL